MSLNIQTFDTHWLVRPEGYLDSAATEALELGEWLSRPANEIDRALLLDLSGIEYINSMTLGSLVACHSRWQEAGQTMVLIAPSEQTKNMLAMTGLLHLLAVAESEDEAIVLLTKNTGTA